MKGRRFVGIPFGFSPKSPEWWAPIGLKYLRQITSKFLCWAMSLSKNSITSFVVPYGFVVFKRSVSVNGGIFFSASYTVALDEKIRFFTLCLSITSRRVIVQEILLS